MAKQLRQLVRNNPSFLKSSAPAQEQQPVVHFIFSPIREENDPITLPVCGAHQPRPNNSTKLFKVTCPDCIDALEVYANMDSHKQALAHAATLVPDVIEPDDSIAAQKLGGQPTREAQRHIRARLFLNSKQAETIADLPKRTIGGSEKTFFVNLYENYLIDEDGERTSISMEDLLAGKTPDYIEEL